jgi:TIR domain/Ricin-type beta-trefoil lectin domain
VVVGSHIFISHSSKDQKVARTICTALENRGLSCWVYSRNIEPGQNFQEQIVRAIRASKIMVLVFTANANSSNEIKKELAIASQNNLVVIPVRVEDVIPNEAFAYEFATRQWIDLFDDWENSIARLTELIAASSHDQPTGDRAKAGLGLAGDAPVPSADKEVKADAALAAAPTSFMQRPGSRWAMISGLAVIIAATIVYEVATLRQQPASQPPVTTPKVTSAPSDGAPIRLRTNFTGADKCLDIINDGQNNKPTMATCGNFAGQMWTIAPTAMAGVFKLQTLFTGSGKCLDIKNDGENNKPTMAACGNFTGQMWTIAPAATSGVFKLKAQFTGPGKCLDVINDGENNKPTMAACGNFTGQLWDMSKF